MIRGLSARRVGALLMGEASGARSLVARRLLAIRRVAGARHTEEVNGVWSQVVLIVAEAKTQSGASGTA